MADSNNKFLSLEGLEYYDGKIKNYIDITKTGIHPIAWTKLEQSLENSDYDGEATMITFTPWESGVYLVKCFNHTSTVQGGSASFSDEDGTVLCSVTAGVGEEVVEKYLSLQANVAYILTAHVGMVEVYSVQDGEIYDSLALMQTTGTSETALISQKAVTNALETKLDAVTTADPNYRFYMVDNYGKQTTRRMDGGSAGTYYVPIYWGETVGTHANGKGFLVTSTPVLNYQAANKVYVDNTVNTAINNIKYPIEKGTGKNSLVINEGIASGDYSIAGGTTDKEILTELTGSTIANNIKVPTPSATADVAISFGTGTEVNTVGGIALGALTVAGVKGYYWDEIDFNAKTITITSARRASKNSTPAAADISDWAVGDTISLVNEQHYPAFAKITNKIGNKITVDNLPFTEIKYTALPIIGTFTYDVPQARTIFACYKKTEYSILGSVQNERWYYRSGSVLLGWAAIATGAENLAAGPGSFVTGYGNLGAGSFGFVSGRENVGSYACMVGGFGNHVSGNFSLVGGRNNNVKGLSNIVGGQDNTVNGTLGLVIGSSCENGAGGTYAGGHQSKSLHNNAHVHGLYLESGGAAQTVVGRYNEVVSDALFVVGNGSSGSHSNILEVRSGEAKVKGSLSTNSLTSGPLSASSATITGYTTINGALTAKAGATVAGNLKSDSAEITGALSANSVNITENAGINGYLTVEQEIDTGSLTVQGMAHVYGDISLEGTLTVGNAVRTNEITPYNEKFVTFTKTAVIGTDNTHSFSGNSLALGTSNELSGTGLGNTSCNNMYVGGYSNVVQHNNAHVHGRGLKSTAAAQTVVGTFNDLSKTHEFVVGVGSNEENRKNALSVGKSGILAGTTITLENGVDIAGKNGYVKFANSINVSDGRDSAFIHKAPRSFIGGSQNTVGIIKADGTVQDCNNVYVNGYMNTVGHNNSFVHGRGLKSTAAAQMVVGTFNDLEEPSKNSIFVVGTGANENDRGNSFEVGKKYIVMLGTSFTKEEFIKLKALLNNNLAEGSY